MRDHLDDLASDFHAIHGIADMLSLPGPVFFKLAWRIGSYQGVMRDLMAVEAHEQARREAPQQPGWAPQGHGDRQVVGGSRVELQSAPEFAGIFSFGSFKAS